MHWYCRGVPTTGHLHTLGGFPLPHPYTPPLVWNSIMLIAAKVKTHRHGTFTFFSPLLLVRDSYYTEKLFVETQFWMELNCTIWNALDTLTVRGSVKSVLNTAGLYTYFLAKSPWRHCMIPEQVMNVRTKWCNPGMKCSIKHLWSYLHFKCHYLLCKLMLNSIAFITN